MPWPLQPDGPFWPWFVAVAAALFIAGIVKGKWRVPAIALIGEATAVLIFKYAAFAPVTLCTAWLFFAYLMAYNGGKVPAFFYALAGLTSGLLYVFGIGLVPFGPSPVLIDVFSAIALLCVGGGIFGISSHSRPSSARPLHRRADHQMGVAMREAGGGSPFSDGQKVI